jgi:hypothetical protein
MFKIMRIHGMDNFKIGFLVLLMLWIFRKWEGVVGTGWSWLRIGTGGGCLWVR